MTPTMGANRYGKNGIRLVLVRRGPDRHLLRDLTVDVRLEGDFDAVHTEGDNSQVLATDTMRSTVFALAQEKLTTIEQFGAALGGRFLDAAAAATSATVTLREHAWSPAVVGGTSHPHAFVAGQAECATAEVTTRRGATADVVSGLTGLTLLKTTGSAFSGFLRDEFTVLAETDDRILATDVTASWTFRAGTTPAYDEVRAAARRAAVEAFADHDSRSVQHTLHAVGSAVLDACPDLAEVRLRMPNKHHVEVDLSPFGIGNDRAVFVATDRPYGVIEGTVERG